MGRYYENGMNVLIHTKLNDSNLSVKSYKLHIKSIDDLFNIKDLMCDLNQNYTIEIIDDNTSSPFTL